MIKLTMSLLMLFSTNIFAWGFIFEPKNYDDCILENIKGVTSDVGARLVYQSCFTKFKEKIVDNNLKHRWKLVSSNNDGSFYDDTSTMIKQGNIITIDTMGDFNKVQVENNIQHYSGIVRVEIDCVNLSFRSLHTELKSDHMGKGDTVSSSGLEKDEKINKDGILYKQYCIN